MAFNARNLEAIPGATFNSLMRPKDDEWDKIEDQALAINGITHEKLKEAPERKAVWENFVSFVGRFKKGSHPIMRPIPAGINILNYDLVIIDRLCREYGQVDKDGKQAIFNPRDRLDLINFCFAWFENQAHPAKYNMDSLRAHFGLNTEGAHSALVDVQQTGLLIIKFLKLHRTLFHRVPGLKGVQKSDVA